MGNDYCDGCGQDISRNGYCKCTRANISTIGRHRNPDDCDSCDVLQKVIAELRAKLKIAEERGAESMLNYVTRHYTVNKVATNNQVFQYWKDEQK